MQITSDEWQCWSECKLTGKEQRVEWQESARWNEAVADAGASRCIFK